MSVFFLWLLYLISKILQFFSSLIVLVINIINLLLNLIQHFLSLLEPSFYFLPNYFFDFLLQLGSCCWLVCNICFCFNQIGIDSF